jgi:tetratricopeptide (TPR) repeat protein
MAKITTTKKQIKEDKLVSLTTKISVYLSENWKKITIIGSAILIVIIAIVGYFGYTVSKNDKIALIVGEATKSYNEAEAMVQKDGVTPITIGKYEVAKARFQEAIRKGGSSKIISEAVFLSAKCSYQAGKYSEAITDFEKVLKKYSKSESAIPARDGIAKCYEQMGDKDSLKKAIQYYDELSKYPENYITVSAFLGKGRCYEKLGEQDQALTVYKIIVDKFKQKVELGIQARSKSVAELAKTAITNYKSALGNDSSDANFKSLLEKAQSLDKGKQEQWFETLLAYDKVILSRNEYWHSQTASGGGEKLKEAEKALREYEDQSLDLIKNVIVGRRYDKQGDWDTALRYYDRAIEFNFLPGKEMFDTAQDRIEAINLVKNSGNPQKA